MQHCGAAWWQVPAGDSMKRVVHGKMELGDPASLRALFLASEFLAHCCAEHFARAIHGVANLRRRSAYGVTRGHDYRLAFLGVHETRCFQQTLLIAGRNGEEPVFIGMDQLPGHDAPPKNFDLSAPADRM